MPFLSLQGGMFCEQVGQIVFVLFVDYIDDIFLFLGFIGRILQCVEQLVKFSFLQ